MLDRGGGAVALVALTHLETDRAKEGYELGFRPPFDRAHPGRYSEITQAVLDTCLVHLLAAGRAKVLLCDGVDGVVSTG
jgi:hypothetical protein